MRGQVDKVRHIIYHGVEQLVARKAHNLEVMGSKPISVTIVLLVESRYNTVGFDSPMDAD